MKISPLLLDIKEIPIYNKFVKETCIKQPVRIKLDPDIINIVGHLIDVIIEKVLTPKYANPTSPIVSVHINSTFIPKTLINLSEAINLKK